jgi:hypothetical protein
VDKTRCNVPSKPDLLLSRSGLLFWAEAQTILHRQCGVESAGPLDEFHHGHIVMYEQDRLREKVSYPVVWTEVCAFRALLKHVGLGEEIESHYMTPLDRVKLCGRAGRLNAASPGIHRVPRGCNVRVGDNRPRTSF